MNSEDYKLIPMSEITDEAREIAVAWMECEDKDWIGQKHKLASDIMNYAQKHAVDIRHDLIFKQNAIIKKQRAFLQYLLKYCGTSQRIRQYESEIKELEK